MLWRMVAWRPRLRPQRTHLRELLSFGGTLTASTCCGDRDEMDYLFVGRCSDRQRPGSLLVGFRLPELLILNLAVVAGNVLFPAFASIEREDLNRAFMVSLR